MLARINGKMSLNPELNIQAQEVNFSRQIKTTFYLPLNFNNNVAKQGVYLEVRLDFCEHLQNMFKKVNKTIYLLFISELISELHK